MDQSYVPEHEQQGSILRGLIGALLGGLLGAVIAGIVYLILNETNTILGFVIGFLVGGGYKLFKGRKGVSLLVIGIVCSLLAVVLADGIYYVGLIEKDYADAVKHYGKNNVISRSEAYDMYLNDEEVIDSFKSDLGQDALFVGIPAIISIAGYYIDSKRKGEVPVEEGAPNTPGSDNAA